MPGTLLFEIKETAVELEKLLTKDPCTYNDKLRMLLHLKTDKSKGKVKLAGEIGVSVKTIHKWRQQYIQGGLSKLLGDERGTSGNIAEEVYKHLVQFVTAIPENHKHRRAEKVENWLQENYGITMERSALQRYLHRHFGKSQNRTQYPWIKKNR